MLYPEEEHSYEFTFLIEQEILSGKSLTFIITEVGNEVSENDKQG